MTEAIAVEKLAAEFEDTSAAFRLAVLTAAFAEVLRESYWVGERTLADLLPWLRSLEEFEDPEVMEFIGLVQHAAALAGGA